jgi:sarcosine oxidase subunit alpha
MTQPYRLPGGGAIDRSRPVVFTFDERTYQGFHGDTLASALLANGVHLVARSFKYHRPRGIVSAGPEEPCALVRVGEGARVKPNLPATMVELYDGLAAASLNCWPALRLDFGAAINAVASWFRPAFITRPSCGRRGRGCSTSASSAMPRASA